MFNVTSHSSHLAQHFPGDLRAARRNRRVALPCAWHWPFRRIAGPSAKAPDINHVIFFIFHPDKRATGRPRL